MPSAPEGAIFELSRESRSDFGDLDGLDFLMGIPDSSSVINMTMSKPRRTHAPLGGTHTHINSMLAM